MSTQTNVTRQFAKERVWRLLYSLQIRADKPPFIEDARIFSELIKGCDLLHAILEGERVANGNGWILESVEEQ